MRILHVIASLAPRYGGPPALGLAAIWPAPALAAVFWVSEPVGPGEVALVYGGGLGNVPQVAVRRLPDQDPGPPPVAGVPGTRQPPSQAKATLTPALQASESSLKFVLPSGVPQGVFSIELPEPTGSGGAPASFLVNAPRPEWCQPTRLLPGLGEGEVAPGGMLQIVGRNVVLDEDAADRVRVALRASTGRLVWASVVRAEKYSVVVSLPLDIPVGTYEAWVHNGFGGPRAWGGGLRLGVKPAAAWPGEVFDVTTLGARGDNVADDSGAVRRALAAAEQNGGGVVYFPAGTYRLSGWFRLPLQVVLRGEGKDLTWLKWPLTDPKSPADFQPAALVGSGEYAIEHLSLVVRNAAVVLRDLSFDSLQQALYNAQPPVPDAARFMSPSGGERDVFLRAIRIHYLPYSGRPGKAPQDDPQWRFGRWGITNYADHDLAVAMGGIRNLEVSDSEFVGTQRFLDSRNARFVGNSFSNQMGVSWTDLGGQHVVFQGNHIVGASSWRSMALPLRFVYAAHNVSRNVERGEREALTFDVNVLMGPRGRGRPSIQPWQGRVAVASGSMVRLQTADLWPGGYRGFDALVVDGKGAGQYRAVADNTTGSVTVSEPWVVPPDETSVVLLHRLMGHCILYRNEAEDTSVLLQIWGQLYDCVVDGNEVRRSQGMWGLAGWFVQWLENRLDVAVTYPSGVGPAGPTPERGAEYGYLGFTIAGRITTLGLRFPYVRGAVIRGNHLSYGHRVLVMWGYGGERKPAGFTAAEDVVVDHNLIEHTPVGIELDANVHRAVIAGNAFRGVGEPMRLHAAERVLVLDTTGARR